jgi:hypothetical protein
MRTVRPPPLVQPAKLTVPPDTLTTGAPEGAP